MKIGQVVIAAALLAGSIAVVVGVTVPTHRPATMEVRPGIAEVPSGAVNLAQYNPCPRGRCK
jgi:hypothetical protein